MIAQVHRIAALFALICITSFLVATVLTELLATPSTVSLVKQAIVTPGLWILIPSLALTGVTGIVRSKNRCSETIRKKKRRMPIITANGVLILIPCALFLNSKASAGEFDTLFVLVQSLEIAAGIINLTLMIINVRAGMQVVRGKSAI